tara:strand:+ start:302 stop:526 length:225 start_codon:yes stop_codon:yes gene_type:complete
MPFKKMVTEKQIDEAKRLYKLCCTGRAPNHVVKKELVDLYNKVYKTRYKPNTNCASCLATCLKGIKEIAQGKYK